MPSTPPRRNRGLRIARIAGIDVLVDPSMLIVFSLIVFSLGAGAYKLQHPEWSVIVRWSTAVAAATLFFVSVLLHEFSHALVGRVQGIPIDRITLFVFGGVAHLPHEPRAWRAELLMAIVGPITSLALGLLFLSLAALAVGPESMDPGDPLATLADLDPIPAMLVWLGSINILLALFNLVPGFPLDGGRVLRAVLWALTDDLRAATRWASNLGQAFAWLLIALGMAMMLGIRVPVFGAGLLNGLWIAFIGWFLNNAALVSYRQLIVRDALEHVPVARLMQRDVESVGPGMRIQELVEEHLMASGQRVFPVTENRRLMGLVCLEDIRKIPRHSWPRMSVVEAMTPARELTVLGPDDEAAEAMERLTRLGVNQLPVVEERELVGLFRREDVLAWLSLYAVEDKGRR